MTDISHDLLKAKADAQVEEAEAKYLAEGKGLLTVSLTRMESTLLSKLGIQAALEMIADYEEAENDEQRVNVLMARKILSNIADKFRTAHKDAGDEPSVTVN